jgi:hypothetical protein
MKVFAPFRSGNVRLGFPVELSKTTEMLLLTARLLHRPSLQNIPPKFLGCFFVSLVGSGQS